MIPSAIFFFLVIVLFIIWAAWITGKVKSMEKNYEGNSIEAMKKNIAQLEQTIGLLVKASK
jgi:hypothetical protein